MIEAVVKVHRPPEAAPFTAYYKIARGHKLVPGTTAYMSLKGYRGQVAMQGRFLVKGAGYEGQTPVIDVQRA